MASKQEILAQLKEMGFEEVRIKKALKATKAESVEQVMEWMISHDGQESGEESTEELTAENTEENISEKTEEEKEAERRRYEELIKQRRLEREEKERKEAIEKEKSRRKTGSEMARIKEEIAAKEKIRIAQEIRREKLEAEAHKKALLEQIKRDREAMKEKSQTPVTPPAKSAVQSVPTTTSKPSYDRCRIAVRLPNGQQLQHEFSAKEQLSAVRLFIQMNRKDVAEPDHSSFTLALPPAKVFNEEEMEQTLEQLGLCPSSRLTVTDKKRVL